MREREPCVYILATGPNGTLYTGVTSDLLARIYQHREEITGGFTAAHNVKRLVYFEMRRNGTRDPSGEEAQEMETRMEAQPDRAA